MVSKTTSTCCVEQRVYLENKSRLEQQTKGLVGSVFTVGSEFSINRGNWGSVLERRDFTPLPEPSCFLPEPSSCYPNLHDDSVVSWKYGKDEFMFAAMCSLRCAGRLLLHWCLLPNNKERGVLMDRVVLPTYTTCIFTCLPKL